LENIEYIYPSDFQSEAIEEGIGATRTDIIVIINHNYIFAFLNLNSNI